MANQYCYYLQGNNIAILQYDSSEDRWDSPSESVTNGFILEFTRTITDPSTHASSLAISREIAQAIVYYLKFKMVEDKDQRKSNEYYFKFLSKVRGEANRKTGTGRRVIPKQVYALR
jgi:hypothetical protein